MTGLCIETDHSRDAKGYGRCNVRRFGRRIHRTHILAWVESHGHLPPHDLPFILHTCDNPACVNPDHLYAGTHRQNMDDRVARQTSPHAAKTHCPQGHPYDDANTSRRSGRRHCRRCDYATAQRRFARGVRRPRPSAAADPGRCLGCGKTFGIKLDGTLFAHSRSGVRGSARCNGRPA